ncbi:MAG TPA: hypothetical protein V6C95_23745 [Coleofasciculaceae cyanobacterium]
MKAAFAGLFTVAGLLTLVSAPAQACSCLPTNESQATERADIVFSGIVTNRNATQDAPEGIGANQVTWTFKVDDVQKGNVAKLQDVMTTDSSASCGMEFQIGTRYRIYATQSDNGFWTGLCSGNQPLDTTNQPTSSQTNSSGCNNSNSPRNQRNPKRISSFFNSFERPHSR